MSGLLRSRPAVSVLLGGLATLAVWAVWSIGPSTLTTLDWLLYDTWLAHSGTAASSSQLVLVRLEHEADDRSDEGRWDRARLARVIGALDRAGAAVIGLDESIADPSPASRGGAASDALLLEATASSGKVVFPIPLTLTVGGGALTNPADAMRATLFVHPSWPRLPDDRLSFFWRGVPATPGLPELAEHAAGLGHTLVATDADGVVRRVPLYVAVGDRGMPSLAMAMVSRFLGVPPERIAVQPGRSVDLQQHAPLLPIDVEGQFLLQYSSARPGQGFNLLHMAALWKAIEAGDHERIREWVEGKLVYVYSDAETLRLRTPLGVEMPPALIHAHLANSVLAGRVLHRPALRWHMLLAWGAAALAAACLLALTGWRGIVAVGGLVAGILALAWTACSLGWVLPVVHPLSALLFAAGGAGVWHHASAGRRIEELEQRMLGIQDELAAVRDGLVRRESLAESLEEDLEQARAAAARSAEERKDLSQSVEGLRSQLNQAREQESAMRARMHELEQSLAALREAAPGPSRLRDSELEHVREECERQGILTQHPRMLALFRDLKKGARSTLPVLLLGEPGTGKELFARAAHRLSARGARPFVPVNMAAISPELFESELFGYLRGSFTGAVTDRAGFFELANGGSIFLDEIGDLRPDHQGKLLRVLQDQTFYRVGATKPTRVDVRVIAATNKDLQRGVSEGWFREDLYFRLKGLVLELPPLRDRKDDLPLLAPRLLEQAARRAGRDGLVLSGQAMDALRAQPWTGNVRELQHCLERAAALADNPILLAQDLRLDEPDAAEGHRLEEAALTGLDPSGDLAVLECLRRHRFDMQESARALGWDRSTVTQRLKGMGFRALVEAGGDHAKAAAVLAGDLSLRRPVEVKLLDYYEHLIETIRDFPSSDAAIAACRRRFKNLPDRHFPSVMQLIRDHFDRVSPREQPNKAARP